MKFDPDHNPHPLERPSVFAKETPAPQVTEVKAVAPKALTEKQPASEKYDPDTTGIVSPPDSTAGYKEPRGSHVRSVTWQQGHAYPHNGRI